MILTVRGSTPKQRLDECGFAGAVLADEAERFAGLKIEAHIPQDWLGGSEFRNRA